MTKGILIIFLVSFVCLLYFHTHGFIPYDEGWFLQAGWRLFSGEKVYRDFQYLYDPGSLYVNALAFALFGKSILASRILALLNSLIAVVVLLWMSKKINAGIIVIFLTVLGYIFWGPGHINFVWPVMFCITNALVTGALFVKASESRHRFLLLFIIGIIAGWTLILKQNFGAAIFASNILFLLLNKEFRSKKTFVSYFAGFFLVLLLQLLYWICTQTLQVSLQELYYYTFVIIFQEGRLNSQLPWNYPQSIIAKAGKLLLYTSPLLISVAAGIKTYVSNKKLLYFPLVAMFYYLLSIRPTTDYIHLAPLLAMSMFPLLLFYQSVKQPLVKIATFALLIILCVTGAYTAIFTGYYRWEAPLWQHNLFESNSHILVWVQQKEQQNIHTINNYFQKHAQKEQYVFIYSFTPIYYFVLDKQNPTPYDYVHPGVINKKIIQDIIHRLQQKKVRHIITDGPVQFDKTALKGFILRNYQPVLQVNRYTIWQMKKT